MDDKELYRQIIGVVAPWEIEKVEINIDDNRVDVHIAWPYMQDGQCPVSCMQEKLQNT